MYENDNNNGNGYQEPVYNQEVFSQPNVNNQNNQNPDDNGGFLWGLLGCCIPIVGLVLFLVWKDSKPKTAKAAGIGALVSVGLAVIYYIIVIVIIGASFGITAGMM